MSNFLLRRQIHCNKEVILFENLTFVFGETTGTSARRPLKPKPDSLLSTDEWAFVKDFSDRFPERPPSIYDRFIIFEDKPKEIRPLHAFIGLHTQPREGLKQRGFHDVQSVFEHSINMREILVAAYQSKRLDGYLKDSGKRTRQTPDEIIHEALCKIRMHDGCETLVTDLTPSDMFRASKREKTIMEQLAGRIIYEGYPERLIMLEEYEEKARPADELVKMADLIEWPMDYVACASSEGFDNLLEVKGFKDDFPDVMDRVKKSMKKFPELYKVWGKEVLGDIETIYEGLLDSLEKEFPETAARRTAIRGMCMWANSPSDYLM